VQTVRQYSGIVRPWDKHPPWAHWRFFVIWAIAGSLGPIALLDGVIDSSAISVWLGIVLCLVWAISLAVDWLLVRWLQQHVEGWEPWRPPQWRWLRS
jgi:hypothetical protein